MTKTEAKQKLQAGEIQIHFDDKSKLDVLKELLRPSESSMFPTGDMEYYKKGMGSNGFYNMPIVKISEITEDEEEVIWQSREMQWRYKDKEWRPVLGSSVEYRLKPKPDFSKEIDALQEKAKQNGMKAVITLEKL